MIEPFDDLFDDSPRPAATATFATVPEGEHEVEIVSATVGPLPWNAADHLKLRLSAGSGYRYIFADLARDKAWLFKALAAALGVQPDADGKVSIGKPEGLVGRRIRVEVGSYVAKNGETRATVKKWLAASHAPVAPAAPAKPKAATKPRTPARPTVMDPNDIPF